MSTHILDEFYIPEDSEIQKLLRESPDARERYQLFLEYVFRDIDVLIIEVDLPIKALSVKFEALKKAIESRDEAAKVLIVSFAEQVVSVINKLEKVFTGISSRSLPSFYGDNIDPQKEVLLEKYMADFKARMVQMISHRLKTPLSIIGTSSYTSNKYLEMTDNPFDSRIIGKLSAMASSFAEYREIFDEIKEFRDVCFDLDRNGEKVEFLNSEEIESVIVTTLNAEESFAGLDVSFDTDSFDGKLRIDVNQLSRALRQIFINCIDFRKPEDEATLLVNVSVKQEGETGSSGRIKIYIQDNGQGMRPREMKDIFEPFYTQDMVGLDFSTLIGTGCGLGLSIAKGIIDRYGTIKVHSKLGEGTTIELDFRARE